MKSIIAIIVLLILCGSVSTNAQDVSRIFFKSIDDSTIVMRFGRYRIELKEGSDTLWISSGGLYWDAVKVLDSALFDSIHDGLGRFAGGGGTSDSTSAVYSGDVLMDTLSAPTYVTLEDWFDVSQSATIISGGAITQDASDSTVIDITAGTGIVKTTDSDIGENLFFDFSSGNDVAVANNTELLVYVDYNGGSPILATTAASSVTFTTQVVLGRIYRNGNHMHITQGGQNFTNFRVKNSYRIYELYDLHRGNGLVTSEGADASNDIDVSSGAFYLANNRQVLSAVASFTDGIELWYGNGAGGFTAYDTTALNDVSYDDGDGTRAALTTNRYNIFWIFMETDGELIGIYDSVIQSGGYSLGAAEAEVVVTTLPPHVHSSAVFIAKIIVQEGAGILSIEYPWAVTFAGALTADHGNLAGLGDDDHTQYLTSESDPVWVSDSGDYSMKTWVQARRTWWRIGDGLSGDSSDEWTAFQAGIDSAKSAGGIFAPDSGIYHLKDSIIVEGVTLELGEARLAFGLAGAEKALILRDGARVIGGEIKVLGTTISGGDDYGAAIVIGRKSDSVGYSDILIDGTTVSTQKDGGAGICITGSSDQITIRNVHVTPTDSMRFGVLAIYGSLGDTTYHPHNIRIENLRVDSLNPVDTNGYGISIDGAYNVIVDGGDINYAYLGVSVRADPYNWTRADPAIFDGKEFGMGVTVRGLMVHNAWTYGARVGIGTAGGAMLNMPIVFDHCTFNGQGMVAGSGYNGADPVGLKVSHSTGIKFNNCDVSGFRAGVSFGESTGTVIYKGCDFFQNYSNVEVDASDLPLDIQFHHCYAWGGYAEHNFKANIAQNVTFNNCIAGRYNFEEDSCVYGFFIDDGGSDLHVTLTDCMVRNTSDSSTRWGYRIDDAATIRYFENNAVDVDSVGYARYARTDMIGPGHDIIIRDNPDTAFRLWGIPPPDTANFTGISDGYPIRYDVTAATWKIAQLSRFGLNFDNNPFGDDTISFPAASGNKFKWMYYAPGYLDTTGYIVTIAFSDSTDLTIFDTDDLTQGASNLYNQTHTGDVTGATALTFAANIVDTSDMAHAPLGKLIRDTITAEGYLTTETDPIWVSDSADYAFKIWVSTSYAPLASPTFTGTVTIPTPFTLGAVSVTPTGTELNFVDGVTSDIQTQLDGKEIQLNNETGLYTVLSDVTDFVQPGDAAHDGFSDFVVNEHLDWTADQGATNIHSGNIDTVPFSHHTRISVLWDFDLNSFTSDRATDSIVFDTTECDTTMGVHPDVEATPNGWPTEHYDGDTLVYSRRLYMIQTPAYQGCQENPTIYWSDDKTNWYRPFKIDTLSGDTIYVPVPLCSFHTGGLNSDPQIVIGHDGDMYAFWRWKDADGGDSTENIYVKSSPNAINWGDSTLLFSTDKTTAALSPAVIFDDDNYYRMWTVDKDSANNVVRLELSATPTGFDYTKTTLCTLSNIPANWYMWHLNVTKAGGLYVMVATMRNGADYKNWLAKSYDGLNWTFSDSANVLSEGSGITGAWDKSFVYTGDIVPRMTPNGYVFDYWYTGNLFAGVPEFNIGYTTIEFPLAWTRSGTNLSPTIAGDDVLLNTGETFSIADMTTGSVPFFGASGLLSQDNANLFWDNTNNRLGVGINSPSSILHIKADVPGVIGSHSGGQLIIQNPTNSVFSNAVITGYESDAAGNPDQQLWYLGGSSGSNSDVILLNRRTSNLCLGTGGTTRLTIDGTGNVGIGTLTPSEILSVVGNIATGDTAAGDVDVFHYFSTNGSWVTEYLKWDDGLGRFELSDDLDIAGNLTVSGTFPSAWDWADSAGEPPFWVDSAKYAHHAVTADTATYSSNLLNNLEVLGDLMVSGNIKHLNFQEELDLSKAFCAVPVDSIAPLPIEVIEDIPSSRRDSIRNEGMALHPSVIYVPGGWPSSNPHPYWMAFNPWPDGYVGVNSTDNENPHMACSDDGISWTSHVGFGSDSITNPIYTKDDIDNCSHLSDQELFFDAEGNLWLAFRATVTGGHTIYVTSSSDGISWGSDTSILPIDAGTKALMSPSIILDTMGTYKMWIVDGDFDPNRITLYDSPAPDTGWQQVGLALDLGAERPAGLDLWHIDVIQYSADILLGLFYFCDSGGTGGGGSNGGLYLAKSTDRGKTWDVSDDPLLVERPSGWGDWYVYRMSGFWQRNGMGEIQLKIYYSARATSEDTPWWIGKPVLMSLEPDIDTTDADLLAYVTGVANDTADVLRAEMDDSAAAHAGDTADVVRSEFPTPKYMFTLANPDALYATDHEWCIDPRTAQAITIDSFTVTLDADPTTELEFSLKYADALIGLANAVVIDDTTTLSGVVTVTGGFGDPTVPATKCIYWLFDADPDDNITQASVKIHYSID